jgi:hypothetical protein
MVPLFLAGALLGITVCNWSELRSIMSPIIGTREKIKSLGATKTVIKNPSINFNELLIQVSNAIVTKVGRVLVERNGNIFQGSIFVSFKEGRYWGITARHNLQDARIMTVEFLNTDNTRVSCFPVAFATSPISDDSSYTEPKNFDDDVLVVLFSEKDNEILKGRDLDIYSGTRFDLSNEIAKGGVYHGIPGFSMSANSLLNVTLSELKVLFTVEEGIQFDDPNATRVQDHLGKSGCPHIVAIPTERGLEISVLSIFTSSESESLRGVSIYPERFRALVEKCQATLKSEGWIER